MAHPRDILLRLEANARKSLSQNFLTSPHWAEKLTRTLVEECDADEFWEIGPGLGALTGRLIELTERPVRAFEYDRKLSAYLREELPQLDLHEGDVLDADLKSVSPGARIAVLSNLPYHLSSAVLFKLLEEKDRLARLVLTFQREFADRLVAEPRTKDYGALSVLMQLHFTVETVGVLPPGAFYPAPGVASQALRMEPRRQPGVDFVTLDAVVKAAFAHRRKKLVSNLRERFPKVGWEGILPPLNVGPTARPEELRPEQYVALAQAAHPC